MKEPKPIIPLPAETFEDTEVMKLSYRKMNHWLDEAYENCRKSGGFDHLPGKGKPLKVPEGDIVSTILKNANVKHPWLLLREEIKNEIMCAADMLEDNPDNPAIDDLIQEINKKIVEMNVQAPGLSLHRKKITRRNIHREMEKWL